jgi:hypothetical protein
VFFVLFKGLVVFSSLLWVLFVSLHPPLEWNLQVPRDLYCSKKNTLLACYVML